MEEFTFELMILGKSLLASLATGLVLFLVYRIIEPFFGQKSPHRLYLIQVAFLLLIPLSTVWFFIAGHEGEPVVSLPLAEGLIPTFANYPADEALHAANSEEIFQQYIPIITFWFSVVWFVGTLIMSIRLLYSWYSLRSLRTTGSEIFPEEWTQKLDELTHQWIPGTVVRLLKSNRVTSPGVIGLLKPVILIPSSLISGLSAEQIESILIHEIVHIKRHDYLVNVIQLVVEALLFFNPFMWYFSRLIRDQREYCCDQQVIQSGSHPKRYSELLLFIEQTEVYTSTLHIQITGTRNTLLNRIERIMKKKKNPSVLGPIVFTLLLASTVFLVSWTKNEEPTSTGEAYVMDTLPQIVEIPSTTKKKDTPEKQTKPQIREVTLPSLPKTKEPSIPPIVGDTVPPTTIVLDSLPLTAEAIEKLMLKIEKTLDVKTMAKIEMELAASMQALSQEMEMIMDGAMELSLEAAKKELSEKEIQKIKEEVHSELQKVREELEHINVDELRKAREEMNVLKEHLHEEIHETSIELKKWAEKFKSMLTELTDELVKDGYVEKGEKIEDLDISVGRLHSVNGTDIKNSDQKKYDKIIRKHFPDGDIHIHDH